MQVQQFIKKQHRGHEVTAIVRNEGRPKNNLVRRSKHLQRMLFSLTEEELSDFDVLVDAFATSPDKATCMDLAAKLVHLEKNTRLFFILGAGSLFNEAGNVISELKKHQEAKVGSRFQKISARRISLFRNSQKCPLGGILLGMSFKKDQLNQRF